ncbi:hypothetical protein ON010_g5340 [Phytophthora cinnamomi]|nr:hypothetical protein ON010_g5340 [Phytophthora cinnamomi]
MVHVRCWSDNTSVVTWCNKRHASNQFSQEINRFIGLGEAYFNLRISAEHIAGSANWMADAASLSSPSELQENLHGFLEQLQSRSLAAASASKYNTTWGQWCQWCGWLNFPRWLPESTSQHSYQLALFAVYCWRYGWGQSGIGNTAVTAVAVTYQLAQVAVAVATSILALSHASKRTMMHRRASSAQ